MEAMLETIGYGSINDLIENTVPAAIRRKGLMNLPPALTEAEYLQLAGRIAAENKVFKSYIGTGYYNTHTPPVILRNILENPGWYTAYTPYQAEIAQGRLEALLTFQTMVADLTGLPIANASLLDEATAAAEAMTMLHSVRKPERSNADTFFVSELCHPQTIAVLQTRAEPLGIKISVGSHFNTNFEDPDLYAALLQFPATDGQVLDYTDFIERAHAAHVTVAVAADLAALTLLKPPGETGADVAVGTTQRFGVPMGFGGPHAAYFATREEYKRFLPGRIIGLTVDSHGNRATRMALQTREQHIRREKATSNICTAQVLLAVISACYAAYHGPEGLRKISLRIHAGARLLSARLEQLGLTQLNALYFDTLKVHVHNPLRLKELAESKGINFRYYPDGSVGISLDETTSLTDIADITSVFAALYPEKPANPETGQSIEAFSALEYGPTLLRTSSYLQAPVFNSYHPEHEMLRFLKSLENSDLSLAHSMIPLGSCTMKLNATAEMIPVTFPGFGGLHPFAPSNQAAGYTRIYTELEAWLAEITGFAATSLQPNSGAQGEYAGLLVIRAFHKAMGNEHRNVALIPSSAHGTNPASAVMAGMKVVVTKCDESGNIDIDDLRLNAEKYSDSLAALMVTYPSTHGVFEAGIKEICEIIHSHGGQVYMDGANMNAQVGLTGPGFIGADVCHLNLHKTFCIPHGGGGPGVGPICVAAHLAPFLPGHTLTATGGDQAVGAVSAAPHGSASILLISYGYIALMGAEGLKQASEYAILNANYIKARLQAHYPILYAGNNGTCAHEFIADCRKFKQTAGIEVSDIAKRLMDYGFHAPTVSFPVAGTLMIEPTESESKAELDRFCDAMTAIRQEIAEIENGLMDKKSNLLTNAPHTASVATADEWPYAYSRSRAVFPLPYVRANKFWPTVGRVDNAYGDRNLICTCPPVEEYA